MSYTRVFEAVLREILPASSRGLCREIRQVLFADFEPRWASENQKFDFSFSAPSLAAFRFSVSDYGEKQRFEEKLITIFSLCCGGAHRARLSDILRVTRGTNGRHQTTFGLEWRGQATAPRLKVYFEELRGNYSRRERAQLLKNICAAAELAMPVGTGKEDISAIGIDFMPGREIMLKSYLYSDWCSLGAADGAGLKSFLKIMTQEKNAFFYKTRRYNREGVPQSHKLYKVYEVRQMTDFSAAFAEIYRALFELGASKDVERLERYRGVAKINGSIWYPVLCAMDIDDYGKTKIDSYFSLRFP